MFILRLDYDTGLRLDFGFRAAEHAGAARNKLDGAKPGALVLIADDHGHEASVRVDGLKSVSVVDVAMEGAGQVEVAVVVDAAKQQALQAFGIVEDSRHRAAPRAEPVLLHSARDGDRGRPPFSG